MEDIRIKKPGKNQVVILYKGDSYTIDKSSSSRRPGGAESVDKENV